MLLILLACPQAIAIDLRPKIAAARGAYIAGRIVGNPFKRRALT